jgi:perosamine synthetase
VSDVVDMGGPLIGDEEREAVERVLRSGRLAQGPEVEAFERELAEDLAGTRHAVALASGSAALDLSLVALGVGQGDEVVTTPFTFPATVNAILRSGATVRFADVGEDFLLDPAEVAEAVTERTKLILAVHLYGLPCDLDALASIGPPVLEDAAQAHLGTFHGRRVGGIGVAGCFSFYASKNMTTGEGGTVTTDDPGLAERIRVLRNQGMRGRYDFGAIGWNLRLTELAAAVGSVQLRRLPDWTSARRRVASMLSSALQNLDGVLLPIVPEGREHAWHRFTVRLDPSIDRDAVAAKLEAHGVETRVYYPQVVPDMEPYVGHPQLETGAPLPRARDAARTVLSIPCHPAMGEDDVARVAAALRTAASSGGGHRP